MGLKYQTLRKTEKNQLLLQRLQGYESDHYNHGLNLRLLESAVSAGDDSEQTERAINEAKSAMKTIERAHKLVLAELEANGVKDVSKLLSGETDEPPGAGNRQARRASARKGGKGKANLKSVEEAEDTE
jgi:hypothetical protein